MRQEGTGACKYRCPAARSTQLWHQPEGLEGQHSGCLPILTNAILARLRKAWTIHSHRKNLEIPYFYARSHFYSENHENLICISGSRTSAVEIGCYRQIRVRASRKSLFCGMNHFQLLQASMGFSALVYSRGTSRPSLPEP